MHKPKPLLTQMLCNLQKKQRESFAGVLPLQQAWLTQCSCSHLVIWVAFRRYDFKATVKNSVSGVVLRSCFISSIFCPKRTLPSEMWRRLYLFHCRLSLLEVTAWLFRTFLVTDGLFTAIVSQRFTKYHFHKLSAASGSQVSHANQQIPSDSNIRFQ